MPIPGASLSRSIRISDTFEELIPNNVVKSGSGSAKVVGSSLTINSPGIDQVCWAYFPVYAPRGTVIEVKFEGRQDTSTSKGRVMLDQYANRDDVAGGLVDFLEPEDTNWKPYTFSRSGDHKKPYATVTFGFNKASIGTVHFRNIIINVYNVSSPSPDMRFCMIRHLDTTKGTDWVIDDAPGRYPNLGVKGIQVKKDQDYINVDIGKMGAWGAPLCFAQIQHNGGRARYHTVVTADPAGNYCRVYIVRSHTGETVMPTDVTDGNAFLISFMAIAM